MTKHFSKVLCFMNTLEYSLGDKTFNFHSLFFRSTRTLASAKTEGCLKQRLKVSGLRSYVRRICEKETIMMIGSSTHQLEHDENLTHTKNSRDSQGIV